MKTIKKITEKSMPGLTPFVIRNIADVNAPCYRLEQAGSTTSIFKIEQTAKGVYITMWICRQDVRLFLSNKIIEIEYEKEG